MSTNEIQEYKLELETAFYQLVTGNLDCAWLRDAVELNLLIFVSGGQTDEIAPGSFGLN